MIDYRQTAPDLFEVEAAGTITAEDLRGVFTRISAELPGDRKVKVLEVIRDFRGMEPGAVWEDLRHAMPMLRRVSHAAIVADQAWIMALTKIASLFIAAQVRTFAPDRVEDARAWLAAAPAKA